MPTPEKCIVQFTGQAGTGKSSIANRLSKEYNFRVITISDLLRDYARELGMPHETRADLRAAHAHWVEDDPLAIPCKIRELPNDRICVDGIRVPAHAVALGRVSDIFWLHGPSVQERYERCIQRNDPKRNPPSLAEFEQSEAPELLSSNPYSPSLLGMFCLANYKIPNSDFDTSYRMVVDILQTNRRFVA